MTRTIALIFAASILFVSGCCTTHEHATTGWEYKTVIVPNDAVPLDPASNGWISNDTVLNGMIKGGWVVAGYGIDHINSQWFLLKRHKD